MKLQEFEHLIKNDQYQVFLFTCPAGVPLNFARHPWFVINKKGSVERWEIFWIPELDKEHWGHLHRNARPATQGLAVFFYLPKLHSRSVLRGYVEGGEGSIAQKMIDVIEQSPQNYQYYDTYAFKGSNSNTYVQWVLNQFPNSGLTLPWNSFGKNYKE